MLMKRFAIAPFLLLIVGTLAFSQAQAQVVKVVGETKYKGCSLVSLRAEGVDAKAAILWDVYPMDGVQLANNPRGVFEFVAEPGKYSVQLIVLATTPDGGLNATRQRVTVEVCECDKPKPPGPTPPGPVPPTPPGSGKLDPVNALGRIQFGNAGCTATVIGPRRADGRWDVLTAAHCVSGVGARGRMQLKDGRTLTLTVVVHERNADLAWCTTDEKFEDLSYAHVAATNPAPGTNVWHMGYGVDRPGNREDGVITGGEDSSGQIRMELNVSSGDSGGGIFRTDTGELISTVCCTKAPGRRIDVWGASPNAINRGRAQVAKDEWVPVDIPTYPNGDRVVHDWNDWKAVDMPVKEAEAGEKNGDSGNAKAEPEPKRHAKSCPCSGACVCGCNQAGACRCGNYPTRSLGWYQPTFAPMPVQMPAAMPSCASG